MAMAPNHLPPLFITSSQPCPVPQNLVRLLSPSSMTVETMMPLFVLLLSLSVTAPFLVGGSSPFVFERNEFVTRIDTEHGRVGVLPRFVDRSKLLRAIDDFRLGFLDMDPHAFMVPHHYDADGLLFVVEGRGTISVMKENEKDRINFEEGDLVRIQSGSTVYFVNRDSNERLRIANLLKPVNVPGHVELFHGTSGKDRESFYTAFSLDVLEAALKTDRQSLEELFRQQLQPAVVIASKEQIEALSEGSRSNSSNAFNIFNKEPSKSNQYGQLHEVDAHDFMDLKDLDVRVTFVNINPGAMIGPYFNSRVTVICIVTKGEGNLEMAFPLRRHSRTYNRGSGQQADQTYEAVRSGVQQGTVFVVPAGHPMVLLASENDNLQILLYEVNAEKNIRYPLAGKNNIISLMDKEAKELAIDFPSREVDRVFGNQEEELFFAGPRHHRQQVQRRGGAVTA
ncbi:hypothetical protein MLD38_038558 [Melastoma candidum]|uniref:Uncharacterized protein n=1 Tax=Melastoma candidum TaxID=119954 RepID=A0ACB9L007_9MYRT|nr:hypothetical protein MLD38_038558 [Melastoma candidum]